MRIKKLEHEKEVCEAIIPILNRRKNDVFKKIADPDKENRRDKAVEFVWQGNLSGYVVEHTRIESYAKQIEDNHRFSQLMSALENKLSHTLPAPGYYELGIPVEASLIPMDFEVIREKIELWVRHEAARLNLEEGLTGRPAEVPFDVSLYRQEGVIPTIEGKCLVARIMRGDVEVKRQARLKEALDKKCPKLQKAKSDTGLRSLLILEANDISLSNHMLISKALMPELLKRTVDMPDEVYLVETDIIWTAWLMKENSSFFPHIQDVGPHYLKED
jgi:hypothetical protein